MQLPLPPPGMPTNVSAWAKSLVQNCQQVLNGLTTGYQRKGDPVELPGVAVADLTTAPTYRARPAGRLVYVADDSTGAQVAYSDGTVWRRVKDNSPVS